MHTPSRIESPTQPSSRYHSLDAWRGAACLLLFFFHCAFYIDTEVLFNAELLHSPVKLLHWLLKHFWVGVPIFFVISGYCIMASVRSMQNKQGSTLTFFQKRFRRIYPPLWGGLLFATGVWFLANQWPAVKANCLQVQPPESFSALQWFGNLALTETWLPVLNGAEPKLSMPNTWTLCYEEQFYLVCVLLLALGSRRFGFGVVMVSALVALCVALQTAGYAHLDGLFLDGHWLLFAFGMGVFFALNQATRVRQWTIVAVLVVCAAAAFLLRRSTDDDNILHLFEYIATSAGMGVFLILFRFMDGFIARSLPGRLLGAVGKVSYSIYLVHYPIVTCLSAWFAGRGYSSPAHVLFIVIPCCVVAAAPFSLAFYYLVERHFINRPRKEAPAAAPQEVSGLALGHS